MKLIKQILIGDSGSTRRIELLMGDLTQIPPEHAVDVLIVSTFPNDYTPTAGSLVGSLAARGLNVESLSFDKQEDLRKNFSCWLSKEIAAKIPGLAFSRLLCWEPATGGAPPELVGQIFQALAPFIFGPTQIKSVALPVLAAGDQGYSISTMLPPLLHACSHWLRAGLPIETIKLVVRREEPLAEALPFFDTQNRKGSAAASNSQTSSALSTAAPAPMMPSKYHVFISYSRDDESAADRLAHELRAGGLRVFVDRLEIEAGAAWQQKIYDALEHCSATAVLLSPSFLASKMCKEEFNIACIRRRNDGIPLVPLYIRDAALPAYMQVTNYIDCRTNDEAKIADAAARLTRLVQER